MPEIKNTFISYIRNLQEIICNNLEYVDGRGEFIEDRWTRKGGGGGRSRIIEDGDVFEKGGVNISEVFGELPEILRDKFNKKKGRFFACGISLVLHPMSPMIPTVHANYRLFEIYDMEGKRMDRWFGGGADLTPYYLWEEDAVHFHEVLKNACDPFGAHFYPKFKEDCDSYFYNSHREEPRGIGGIFFDYLRADKSGSDEDHLQLVQSCGNSFLEAYMPIVKRRRTETWNEKNREWQEYRRGRYVEFNLIHDRGTLFGLKTNGRVESILMSLPPRVRWKYNYKPESGSREAKMLEALHYKKWIKINTNELPLNQK